MNDTVKVYFNDFFLDGIDVSSILAQFTVFGQEITIRWYGAIIAFGFLLAVLFGGRMAYKWKISLDKMLDVLIYGTIFAIIGASVIILNSLIGAIVFFVPNSYEEKIDIAAVQGNALADETADIHECQRRGHRSVFALLPRNRSRFDCC